MKVESFDNKTGLDSQIYKNSFEDFSKQFDKAAVNLKDGVKKFDFSTCSQISKWLELGAKGIENIDGILLRNGIKGMYEGQIIDGRQTAGLKQISNYKINKQYRYQNIKQQAGFAAEVISTTKENLTAQAEGTGITTIRTEDFSKYGHNDQYVDKVRIDSNGKVIERIQMKFVGKDANDCLNKLLSKNMDKYYDSTKVDKLEIPKDYYDKIKSGNLIGQKIEGYQKQLAKVTELGKTQEIEKYTAKINHCKELESKLERSTVSSDEAVFARKYPKAYTMKLTQNHIEGVRGGLTAAALTGVVSTVDNVSKFISGEISAEDMAIDIAKDTGIAGAVGYGTGFVSSAVSQAMKGSSHALIKSAGKLGVPAAIISFGVESFDSVTAFANGDIDAGELAYDLGENAASVAGGALGGMAMGAAVGSVVPGAGTLIGGILGGLVGTAVAGEAYNSIAETISEVQENGIGVLGDKAQKMASEQIANTAKGMEVIGSKAQEMANGVVELVTKEMPDMAGNICSAINNFAAEFKLPIAV